MNVHLRLATVLSVALCALPRANASAQRLSEGVDGDESCTAIWRDYGRSMSGRPRAVHCEVREVGTVPRRAIDVDGGRFGGVRLTGGQRSDVRVRLVVQAQGDDVADARDLARRVTLDLSQASWRADVPDIDDARRNGRRFVSATIVIDAPVESDLTARVTHAPLDVDNIRGRLVVNAEHGPLSLTDIGGDVRARVAHGPLSIRLSGRQWQGAGLDAEASHGPLTLRLPRDFGAELEIGAEHGPFDVDFPLTVTRFDRSRIQTKLGAGGPRVRAIALHGPLSVHMDR